MEIFIWSSAFDISLNVTASCTIWDIKAMIENKVGTSWVFRFYFLDANSTASAALGVWRNCIGQ
jgi:hypothetical protein